MPARVHAIIVARPGSSARAQLLRTLDAIRSQSTPPAAVTLVVCGDAASARESDSVAATVEGIIEARAGTSFADAVELARPRIAAGTAVWLLAHDTAPHPRALERLVGSLERSPSAAIIAPKLLHTDNDREIVSLGVSMTLLGRSVELAAGELDQGQHDGRDDALGADVRGLLIRSEVRDALRPDPALAGADEGLDLGVRARLGGGRVVLAPSARVSVSPDGPAALPSGGARRAFATRLAQLHRRLSYAAAVLVPLHWLTLLPLALWRSMVHLVGKRPEAVLPEWGAAVIAMVRIGAVARSRHRIRAFRTTSWASIAPLRVTRSDLRGRLDDGHGSEGGAAGELHFFSGGGAWAVLTALVVSIASFTSLLAWPAIGGGALLPLRTTVSALWADATWGLRGAGVDLVGPSDPFAGVVAILGSLWPAGPSFSLVLLWILALPLAVLGGWFAATRVTERAGLRIFAGVVWALAPTFLVALVDGRPTGVLVHLLLPWLFHAAVVAQRSWGAAGAASLVLTALLACAPSLAPALALLWVIALGVALGGARFRGAARLLWLPLPAVAVFAPTILWQLAHGSAVALLADPGSVWAGPVASADAAGRLALATGFPTTGYGGWVDLLGAPLGGWAGLLLAPLAVLALLSAFARRWKAGITLLVVAVVGLATAFLAVGVVVSFAQGVPVAIWPGAGLSLAWIGIVGAALVSLETLLTAPRVRTVGAVAAALAVAVCAVPALAAFHDGRSELREGQTSTLPAFVAAKAAGERPIGTLVLTPQNDGGLGVEVVWGVSESLGAQTTMLTTATSLHGTDITSLAVDLISARDFDAAEALGDVGIGYVLLSRVEGAEDDRAVSLRTAAVTAMNQRPLFVQAGETDRGVLWGLDPGVEVAARAVLSESERTTARIAVTLQLVFLFAALLLSVPTRASRRAVRAQSRVVGRAPDEPLVLPRRVDVHDDRGAVAGPEAVPDLDPAPADGAVEDAMPFDQGASEPLPSSDASPVEPRTTEPAPAPIEAPEAPEAPEDPTEPQEHPPSGPEAAGDDSGTEESR